MSNQDTAPKYIQLKSGATINITGIKIIKLLPNQGGDQILAITYFGDSKDHFIHDPEQVKEAVRELKKNNFVIEVPSN